MNPAAPDHNEGPIPVAAPRPRGVRRKVSFGIILAVAVWLTAVCAGTVLMTRYSSAPGEAAAAPAAWPAQSKIPIAANKPTLLMFVHPHCPCSRASLGELDRLLAEISTIPNVEVLFVRPAGTTSDWSDTALWRSAAAIKGVRTRVDDCGVEAQRFHAQTSGQTLLYGTDGRLQFEGGITLARGHAGDNPGRASLRELLQGAKADQVQTPVYGCGLFDGECRKGDDLCKH